MTPPRVTLRDVAATAGVSMTTVSHVLNDVPGVRVAPATRARVVDVASRLGYAPNRLARTLRTDRHGTIGLVGDVLATTPFAGRMVLGAHEAAKARSTVLLMMTTSDAGQTTPPRGVAGLLRGHVDGLLYATMNHREETVPDILKEHHIVAVNSTTRDPSISSVVPDEVAGGRDAADLLLLAGHRRLAMLNASGGPAARGRRQGFLERTSAAGIPDEHVRVVAARGSTAAGYEAARAVLSAPDRPTGLFCFNDRMAMGAYRAAADLGLRIPDDVSVVGFDDAEHLADALSPALTTLALPHYEMGVWAVEQLFTQMATRLGEPVPVLHEKLHCPVVARDSVAAPPSVVRAPALHR